MKLHNTLLALFAAVVVSAQGQAPLHTADEPEWKVPGNNPLNVSPVVWPGFWILLLTSI
jgi:hypothetical protein